MPAYPYEYDLAKQDGCRFIFYAVPREVITKEGHVIGIRLARTEKDPNGTLKTVEGSEWVEPCDMVIKALGQEKQQEMLQDLFPGLELSPSGCIVHDKQTFETSIDRVYTGGDCANGGAEVVNAVGEGKKAAHAIHEKLTGNVANHTLQPSRLGAPTESRGSGIMHPIRVPVLEETYFAKGK
jgi:glutamate synthase (NADPH/NADH) small chain